MMHLDQFSTFAAICESDKAHYSHIKDMDEARPRMAPAPKTDGMMSSKGSSYWDLYLQDQASDVMIDKYGYEKGIANWEWTIGQSSGVMFAASSKICNEKYAMLRDLDYLGEYGSDYFKRSYFDIWKEWKEFKKTGKKGSKTAKAEKSKLTPAPAKAAASSKAEEDKPTEIKQRTEQKPASKSKSKSSRPAYPEVVVTSKDTMRIDDIVKKAGGDRYKMQQLAQRMANTIANVNKAVARARAAEEENYHDLAMIFFNRADQLMNESVEETAELDRLFEMFDALTLV